MYIPYSDVLYVNSWLYVIWIDGFIDGSFTFYFEETKNVPKKPKQRIVSVIISISFGCDGIV